MVAFGALFHELLALLLVSFGRCAGPSVLAEDGSPATIADAAPLGRRGSDVGDAWRSDGCHSLDPLAGRPMVRVCIGWFDPTVCDACPIRSRRASSGWHRSAVEKVDQLCL